MVRHPIQPLVDDGDGVLRFKSNAIVKALLDTGKLTMNDLAVLNFTDEDREQFAQLIGYSVDGFGSLSYVSGPTWKEVENMAKPKAVKR